MKTIYIPKGTTDRYESLYADRIIVDGCLHVEHTLDAGIIGGKGSIHAGKVSADIIRIRLMDAALVMCRRLLAVRADIPELFASERVVVSGSLSALTVKCPKLIVAMYSVERMEVRDVTIVPARGMSVFTIQAFTALRRSWLSAVALFHRGHAGKAGARRAAQTSVSAAPPPSVGGSVAGAPVDEELDRIVALFKLSRDCGYTLRIIPGPPEQNAPVFDFDAARGHGKAA